MFSVNLPSQRNKNINTPFVKEKAFTIQECKTLLEKVNNQDNSSKIITNKRNYCIPLQLNEEVSWLLSKINEIFIEVNTKCYQFDINYLSEINILCFNSDGLDWHIDNSDDYYELIQGSFISGSKVKEEHLINIQDSRTRKLSLSLELSERTDFEGGALKFNPDFKFEQNAGSVIVYPAYLLNKVTPVTKGTRFVMVASAKGPIFR